MPQLIVFLLPHIPEEQFGFIPDTGTLDVGAVLADQLAQALQAKKDVRLVALDFKGAFDKVWWCGGGLLAHLWGVGVRAKAYKLFESYISPTGRSWLPLMVRSQSMWASSPAFRRAPSGLLFSLTSM